MAYANQIIGGGDGRDAARRLASAGAAGVIVADLTPDEGAPFEAAARDAGLAVVYLVAPTTPRDRRRFIAGRTGGFLYCVSLVGVTGARRSLPRAVGRLVREVRAISPVPVAVGFGVSRPQHVRALARAGADGVIVASALVDALGLDDAERDSAPVAESLRARWWLAPEDQADHQTGDEPADVRQVGHAARLLGECDLANPVHKVEEEPQPDCDEGRYGERDEPEDQDPDAVGGEQREVGAKHPRDGA